MAGDMHSPKGQATAGVTWAGNACVCTGGIHKDRLSGEMWNFCKIFNIFTLEVFRSSNAQGFLSGGSNDS